MLNKGQQNAVEVISDWYYRPNDYLATIKGFAGTGKTFLAKYIIENLNIKNVMVVAPTNQAKAVIEEASGFPGKTIHSLLGLLPDVRLEDYNPNNPKFTKQFEPEIEVDLILIDEGSMIGKALYKDLRFEAESRGIKMLFMGDPYQLPPVKERLSSIFKDIKTSATLNEIVRQGEDNLNSKLILLAIDDVINNTDNVDTYIRNFSSIITPDELHTSKGIIDTKGSKYSLKDYLLADRANLQTGQSKYIAYTNTNVSKTSRSIREHIFGIEDYLIENENLIGYRAVSKKDKGYTSSIVVNSETYTIESLKATEIDNMQVFITKIVNIYTRSANYVNIVNLSDAETKEIYTEKVIELYSKATEFGKGYWVAYYNFVNNFLSLEDIMYSPKDKAKQKCLDYASAITTHKSQGSTYVNSFINLSNINRCYDIYEKTRLKYVALSRCKRNNIVM